MLLHKFIIGMNIDSVVIFRYISPLNDHRIVCHWAKIVSKISRELAAFIAANWPVQQWHNAGEPPLPSQNNFSYIGYHVT